MSWALDSRVANTFGAEMPLPIELEDVRVPMSAQNVIADVVRSEQAVRDVIAALTQRERLLRSRGPRSMQGN